MGRHMDDEQTLGELQQTVDDWSRPSNDVESGHNQDQSEVSFKTFLCYNHIILCIMIYI